MVLCNVCKNSLVEGDNSVIVLCHHHAGAVHYGCCVGACSQHGAPCDHARGIFKKQ